MKKFISFIVLCSLIFSLLPVDSFALSTAVNSPENYPGKMDVKNVNGLGKNLSNDFFGGAMTFRYPFVFPSGSRGMTPSLELTYSSNNTDAFSPYGYGFSLSIGRIQRSAKKGVSEVYAGNEFSAFGNDLISETGSTIRYRSKDGTDTNLYIKTSSGWIVTLSDGKKLTFGANPISRIADPGDPSKIYAWMLESEEDLFGHKVQYEYTQSGSQPFLSRILYGFDTAGAKPPLYEIRFSYVDKLASLSSYRTQFEIKTQKLLSDVSLFVSGAKIRSYVFTYDTPDMPVSHLMSISETSPDATLPRMEFSYGEGQYRHMITKVDNHRGGIAYFEYMPSTGYRTGSGEISNSKLPFMVMTLARQTLEDAITGIKDVEQYTYASGAYYYDSSDIWGREYVGFGRVTITDEKRRKVLSFYQSQTSEKDILKFDDHISKKGRPYRTQIFDITNNLLLQDEIVQYDMYTLSPERRLVFPRQKLSIEYGSNGQKSARAESYTYDTTGNLLEELHHGFVAANTTDGSWVDIPGDESKIVRTYTANPTLGITRLPVSEKVYGFSGELLSANRVEYDGLSSGATLGLITRKLSGGIGTLEQRDIFSYSPTGMNTSRIDTLGNTTSSVYDTYDISPILSHNPLGWDMQYEYNYKVGKLERVTNQNNVVTRTNYDPWGREREMYMNYAGTDILVSEKSYDDTTLPNSALSTSYMDTLHADKKIQKSWFDGWGRTIGTLSSTNQDTRYTMAHVRYDADGNPIYASYPYFVSTFDFVKDALPYGNRDGESYRAQISGVSYSYDALGRIIREKTSHGVTQKLYEPNTEILINALGYKTTNTYNAYGNLISVRENDGNQDIITGYVYDALGRPQKLTDALGNIRTWQYDILSRLTEATDLHAPSDTTYGVRQYTYDALGRLVTYQNANGESITYTYDALGRPLTETTNTLGTRSYTYDVGARSLGTLSSVYDTGTTVSYTYDALGRKITEDRLLGSNTYTLSYTYNLANALTSIGYPDGGQTYYTYKNGFADTVRYKDPSGTENLLITGIDYSPNSTMRTIRYGNGVTKTIERDADYNYRLTHVRASLSGSTLLDTEYTYDAVSNITRLTEGGIEPLRKTIDYTYDPLARLTGANYTYALSGYGRDTVKNFSYTYDPLGNILSSSTVGSYTYSSEGYTNPHAVTSAGDTAYTYDRAGNTMTRTVPDGVYGFTYSPYGEMLTSMKNGQSTSYIYDHTRRRVINSSLGLTEHHVIDGYEVEYESGALVPVNSEQVTVTNTGTTSSGYVLTDSGVTYTPTADMGSLENGSGSTGSGTTGTGITDTGVTDTGSTSTGITQTGVTNTGSTSIEQTNTGTITNTGITDIGSTDSGAIISENTGGTNTGTTDTGSYMILAGYEYSTLSGATPITLTTTLTHIYLGDEKIATFQSQTDNTPKTTDDDKLIYHLSDHLNSSSLDISNTGVVLQAVDYQPFGKSITYEVTTKRVKGKKGGYVNKYKFANKQEDNETDLQYFEKRYYDNRIGRFTTEDPVFWEVGLTKRPNNYFTSPQNWNSYSYTINNPINLVDPTGEMAGSIMVNGVKVAVGAIILYQGIKYRAEISEGIGTLVQVSSEAVVDVVISTKTAIPNWYSDTYSPWAGQLGNYLYDKLHKDEDKSNSDDDSQAASAGGSPSPGGGGGKKDGGKKENSSTSTPQIEKKSGDLIPGRLKSSKSYHTAYAEKTVNQLNQLVRQGDQKAKQMLKLVKETGRLMEKQGAKSK